MNTLPSITAAASGRPRRGTDAERGTASAYPPSTPANAPPSTTSTATSQGGRAALSGSKARCASTPAHSSKATSAANPCAGGARKTSKLSSSSNAKPATSARCAMRTRR